MKYNDFVELGEFVRSQRSQRMYYDREANGLRQWTQEYLAHIASEKSGIKISSLQISRIEQARIANPKPYLEPLALAFNMSDANREQFYAIAGFIYRIEKDIARNEIESVFRSIDYPAFARTPLWDLIAFNGYHCALWDYTVEKRDQLDKGALGPNLLRVLFDEEFENATYVGGYATWQANIRRAINDFRFESFRYVNTKRYQTIIDQLNHLYPAFVTSWPADQQGGSKGQQPYQPIAKVFHPQYGKMKFLSLRTPQKYLGSTVDLSIYVPLDSSQERYRQLSKEVGMNNVHFFREEPLI